VSALHCMGDPGRRELWPDSDWPPLVAQMEGPASWVGMGRRRHRSVRMRNARTRSRTGTTATGVDTTSATSTASAILSAVMIQKNIGTPANTAASTSTPASAEPMHHKAEPVIDQALRLLAKGHLNAGKRRLEAAFSLDMSDEEAQRLARKTMLCWAKWLVRMRR